MTLLGCLALFAGVSTAAAQETPPTLPADMCTHLRAIRGPRLASPLDELRRLGEVAGCLPSADRVIRRGGFPTERSEAFSFGAALLPVDLVTGRRSAYPDDRNNGALWEGVGVSSSLRAGVQLEVPFVTVSLQPELLYQQNGDFEVRLTDRPGYSTFVSPYYTGIDLPQRFGTQSSWRFVPGDSYARVDVGWAAAGASTESLWRGPALRYPIVMSNTAGGFPHLFLGSNRGVDVFVGRLQGEVVWGRLTESDYFDSFDDNDEASFVNVAFAFQPSVLPGLSLGVTRSYMYRPTGDELASIVGTLGIANTGNREGNELVSVFGRWVFEESAAEIYAEWARDDALGEWAEFFQEPDHAQAYVFGFQKLTSLPGAIAFRVHGELAHLQEKGEARTDSRPMVIYYTHDDLTQGYTHRGQLLGAGIGPGADAQFLGVDALLSTMTLGAWFERVRRNDETLDAFLIRRWSPYEHDTELTAGLRASYFRDAFTVSAGLSRSYRYNRDFRGDDVAWKAEIRLGWSPDFAVSR